MAQSKHDRVSRWYFGGLASAGAACCTHPLDLLKVSNLFVRWHAWQLDKSEARTIKAIKWWKRVALQFLKYFLREVNIHGKRKESWSIFPRRRYHWPFVYSVYLFPVFKLWSLFLLCMYYCLGAPPNTAAGEADNRADGRKDLPRGWHSWVLQWDLGVFVATGILFDWICSSEVYLVLVAKLFNVVFVYLFLYPYNCFFRNLNYLTARCVQTCTKFSCSFLCYRYS